MDFIFFTKISFPTNFLKYFCVSVYTFQNLKIIMPVLDCQFIFTQITHSFVHLLQCELS